ncbi:MAG: helix-turn-helix domain-containing protein [Desulfosarcina sp.]|nr:helix-turn-helix domain-containing protein [Desulfosarcina sp.]
MKLVDLKTLSTSASLSVATLRNYIKMGMPHYRVRRKILIDLEEFNQWMQQFRNNANQESPDFRQVVDETFQAI